MTDIVTAAKRSQMMSSIKNKNTLMEIAIRKSLFSSGFRYRIHLKDLPGNPDIVLAKYKAVIFINGCFWHVHNCHLFKWPSTRKHFWIKKLNKNKLNDEINIKSLRSLNWRVLVIWECAFKGKMKLNYKDLSNEVNNWILSDSIYKEIGGTDLIF